MQQKSMADFFIAVVAISSIGGVARSYFNIGRPAAVQVASKAGSAVAGAVADAAVDAVSGKSGDN